MNDRFAVGLREVVVGLGILCAGCGPSPREDVGRAVAAIQDAMAAVSMVPFSEVNERQYEEGESASFEKQLTYGRCYLFAAVGEQSVSNVAVAVETSEGKPLETARSEGRAAVARYCAELSANVTVRVSVNRGNGLVALGSWASRSSDGEVFEESPSRSQGTRASPTPGVEAVCRAATPLAVNGPPVVGTTSDGFDSFQGSCPDARGGREVVYTLNLPEKSRVRIAGLNLYDSIYYLRKVCDEPESEVFCARGNTDSTTVLDAGDYFFFLDAEMEGSQEYKLAVETHPVAAPAKDAPSCERPIALRAYTLMKFDTFRWADTVSFEKQEAGAPDAVFKFELDSPSHVSVRFWRRFAGSVAIMRECGDAKTVIFRGEGSRFELPEPLDAGAYYLVVDGDTPTAFGEGSIVLSVRGVERVRSVCRAAERLPVGRRAVGRFDGGENRFVGADGNGYDSADKLYRFTLKRETALNITISTEGGGTLPFYVRKACADRDSEVASSQGLMMFGRPLFGRTSRTERLAAGTYYLIVENAENAQNRGQPAQGSFEILVAPTP